MTGTLSQYSRDEIKEKLLLMGLKVTSGVSKKTDFLIVGENAGSKLEKAKALDIRVITEEQLDAWFHSGMQGNNH